MGNIFIVSGIYFVVMRYLFQNFYMNVIFIKESLASVKRLRKGEGSGVFRE